MDGSAEHHNGDGAGAAHANGGTGGEASGTGLAHNGIGSPHITSAADHQLEPGAHVTGISAPTLMSHFQVPQPMPEVAPPPGAPIPHLPMSVDMSATIGRSLRMARAGVSVLTLPVAASTQEYASDLAPPPGALLPADAVQMEAEKVEVPTGTMPAPKVGKREARRRGPVKAQEYQADEHMLTMQQLAERFQTDINAANPNKSKGLTDAEVERRLRDYGLNQLTPPAEVPEIIKFLRQFTNLLIVMLIIASGLAFLAYGLDVAAYRNVILAGALLVIVFITCTMNYYHERQTGNVLASIRNMLPSMCAVIRDGREMKVPATQLVLGDIVHLTIGNRIPADIRLLSVNDLKVEMSSLTGESDAIECTVTKRSTIPQEARNIVFNSSLVMNGDAIGIVIRTGDDTLIGSIAGMASATTLVRSSMEIEVAHVVRFITAMAAITAITFFVIALARGRGFTFAIVNGLLLTLVANVPEGLPTTVVTMLTLTAQRLAEHHIFIKNTAIIETLGATTVICSDKTGTLTQNKMTVENVWCNRSYSSAGKVRHTAVTGARRVDPTASMTIGRQMVPQSDGTMMIHTLTRAGPAMPAWGAALRTAPMPAIPETPPAGGTPAGTPAGTTPKPAAEAIHPTVSEGGPAFEPGPVTQVVSPEHAGAVPVGVPQVQPGGAAVVYVPASDGSSSSTAAAPPAVAQAPPAVPPTPDKIPREPRAAAPVAQEPAVERTKSKPAMAESSYRSFNSFQGMTEASWQSSNAFTRLVTVAAVCNRAQFSYGDASTESKPADTAPKGGLKNAAGTAAPLAPGMPGTFVARLRKVVQQAPAAKDTRIILGDASEAALLRYVDNLVPIFEFRTAYPILHEVPFNSVNKWALAITRDPEAPTRHIVMMKGAPERILERCSHYLYNGTVRPMDTDFRMDHQAAYERFGFMGERVLGFAYKEFSGRDKEVYKRDPNSYPTDKLVFCGLISLVDPPKEGVDEAIAICRDAHIRVTMVTGDHPLTAEAIARKVGIITLPTAREVAAEDGVEESEIELGDPRVRAAVIAGYAIPSLTTEQWDILLRKEEVVFARTSPSQKLLIVENYQRLGHVVAVTGDGTNDSPALKKAQIGVSMGSAAASDVAREAADIVLLDDNFASIVHGIEMGRLVFDNLKKTIAYSLTHALPELVPIFLTVALSIPLALPGLLILTIDLITEQGPAISLAYEPPESSIMVRPPRNMKTDRLVDWRLIRYSYGVAGILMSGVCLLSFFTVFSYYNIPGSAVAFSDETFWTDGSPDLVVGGRVFPASQQVQIVRTAHSSYYLTLILCQAWNVFVCKTRLISLFEHGPMRNHITAYGVAVAAFVGIFFIYVDAVQGLFETYYLPGYWFLPHFAFGIMILVYTEYSKKWTRQNPEGWWAKHMQW